MEITRLSLQGYYHICSDGNSKSLLFRNPKDFKAAMNRVAVLAHKFSVTILAFVLMDNHFHFVVRCKSEDECFRFINEFKRLTGKYNADFYNERNSLSQLPVQSIAISDTEYLKNVIAYVINNPTKARISMFYNYPWGSGKLYFAQGPKHGHSSASTRIGDLSQHAMRRLCGTHAKLPGKWIVEDGIILPENYVATGEVMQLYKTHRAFLAFLAYNKEADIETDMGEWNMLRLPDAELRQARDQMIRKMFGKAGIRELSAPERLQLARQMRKKFLCPKKQIARIVLMPLEDIEKRL